MKTMLSVKVIPMLAAVVLAPVALFRKVHAAHKIVKSRIRAQTVHS